ncbi:hypothetical protein O6P43_017883 [Quillaja saponaria]|uniref:Uncharacterized protein n=1 Tax=Quillaja saponaria TaxID=32244 RepID=A0AAD7LQY2_QUISA|nr:hypothetical protein O6P43_017883 [Quillaja saponaria]
MAACVYPLPSSASSRSDLELDDASLAFQLSWGGPSQRSQEEYSSLDSGKTDTSNKSKTKNKTKHPVSVPVPVPAMQTSMAIAERGSSRSYGNSGKAELRGSY